jgi:hypothetical protein
VSITNYQAALTLGTALAVASGGTGNTTFTSGALLKGNGTSAVSSASAADIVTALGATPVTSAVKIANAGGWSVTPTGTKLFFNYNGVNVASLDSSGNLIALANVTAYGTP